ncbi:MAG TPA: (Fe-S)-binding protein [Chloroflexota bacterium]|nr:(Fe-S)-binding protein [Chloroflexota bacterium]
MAAPPVFRADHAVLGAEYDNMLACIRCGLCLTSCPTYVLSLHESEGPRGRVGIARALAEGHLDITPDLLEHESNCLVCDACSAVCPAGVKMDPLQVVLRSALEPARGRSLRERLLRKFVFGWLFMDLGRFRLVVRLLWLYQRLGLRWFAQHLGILQMVRMDGLDRLLPKLPASFVIPDDSTSGEGEPAALFAGCIMSTALADVDRATLRVLERGGFRVTTPKTQQCCGALHAHGGDLARALQLAQTNLAAFSDTKGPIVVNSAGCGAMLKDYAHHLGTDAARAFSARVHDVSEVVEEPQVVRPLHKKAVYQDACHLLHAQRISRQPRALLKSTGVELTEIAEAGLCCGSAGIYNVTNPEQSRQLQQRKLDNALNVDPELIVTGNPGCLLQLRAGLAERGSSVEVKHLAEVLDEATAP